MHLVGSASAEWIARSHLNERADHLRLGDWAGRARERDDAAACETLVNKTE
jgi:hypothetical protein